MVNRYINEGFQIDCFHTASLFNFSEDFVFKGERHDFWEVKMILDGKVTVTEDENVYTLGKGDIIFHAPMEFHRIQSADGTKPVGYNMSFHTNGDLPAELRDGVFRLEQNEIEEFSDIMRMLIPFVNDEQSELYTGQLVRDTLTVFMLKLTEKSRHPMETASESATVYRKLIKLMEDNVSANLTLTEFAVKVNISISYLKLLFNMYAGVSPKSYYDTLRANEALNMLRSGDTVYDVSDKMGFSSPNYFSVFFKRHFGMPPHRYIASSSPSTNM